MTVDPGLDSSLWVLSEEGRQEVRALSTDREVSRVRNWFTSPELKAGETAHILTHGRGATPVRELRELERANWGWVSGSEDYHRLVEEVFARPESSVRGAETALGAQSRIRECISAKAAVAEGPVGFVSHGLVLTLYMAAFRNTAIDVPLWERMRFPDLAVLDLGEDRVLRAFGEIG